MQRGRAKAIIDEVSEAVGQWQDFATRAGVRETWVAQVHAALRLPTR